MQEEDKSSAKPVKEEVSVPLEMEELKEEEKESRIYEFGYLIVPTVSEEELPRE